MNTPLRPLESQVLNSGEARHYSGWSFPEVPKIDRSCLTASPGVLYARQKAYAPRVRPRSLIHLLRSLRSRN